MNFLLNAAGYVGRLVRSGRVMAMATFIAATISSQAQTATSTVIAVNPSPSTYGQAITLTATITGSSPTGTVTFTDGATTLGIGVVAGGAAALGVSNLAIGSHSLGARYSGDTDNAASDATTVVHGVNSVPTTTSVTSNINPSTYNGSVTLKATVVGSSPSGTVTFKEGATPLGSSTLTGTGDTRTATFSLSTLGVGSRLITAAYAGNVSNASSNSGDYTQTVNKANSSVSFYANRNPSNSTENVGYIATVTGVAPTGTVTFMDGATALGTVNLTGGSGNTRSARLDSTTLVQGSHSLTAVYSGDGNNNTSTSSAYNQTVNKINPVTVLTPSQGIATAESYSCFRLNNFNGGQCFSSCQNLASALLATFGGNTRLCYGTAPKIVYICDDTHSSVPCVNVDYNTTPAIAATASLPQTVTLTATIANSVSPTGSVTFKDGTTTLGTATVSGGTASYVASNLSVGSHTFSAVYSGDANNQPRTGQLSMVTAKEMTSVGLTTSVNPSTGGQSLNATATVTATTTLTGSILFKDGATSLMTAPVSGSSAQAVLMLQPGGHSLTAVYSGDSTHAGSTSSALMQTVSTAATSLTLTVGAAVATAGQNVTLSARVNDSYSAMGTVTFTDSGTTLGTATVSGGAASLSLNNLALGTHTLSAAYSGDSFNTPSTSSAVNVTINPRTGMTWQYGYDAVGRPNTVVDPNAQATYTYYDSLGRPIQTQQPANTGSNTPTITQYGYDADGNVTSIADPRNLTTSYAPNGLGSVLSETSPDRGVTSYTYDANGNVLTRTDARGKTASYTWDALDRLLTVSYPTGTATTFEYDGGATGVASQKGELTKITDESGQTIFTHDPMGRPTGKLVTIGSRTFAVSYGWGDSGSALDKLTSIAYPSGAIVSYSYDSAGAVSAISVSPASGASTPLVSDITYNAENHISGWFWSDGSLRTVGYDANGLVASYTLGDPAGTGAAAGALRTLVRDPAGRITGYTHTNGGTAVTSMDQGFTYDGLGRLQTATNAAASIAYSYDENGNRTAKTVAGSTFTYTVEANSNRIQQMLDATGTTTFGYDAAGNTTTDGANSYTYSDRGRMAGAITPSGSITFLYNGFEQRAVKTSPAGSAFYVYDAGNLLGEYDSTGSPIYETVYLGDTPVGVIKQGVIYNVDADQIDTPRVITKQDHTIVWRWDTAEAFGATAPNQDPSGLGEFVFNQRFPGQVFDIETGLNQNVNREYNARVGRYIQSDPIGLKGGINTFSYAGGNPLSRVDPKGLAWRCVGAIVVKCWNESQSFDPDRAVPAPPTWTLPPLRKDGWLNRFIQWCSGTPDEADKKICDKNLEVDQDACHEEFGNGLRGPGFSSALNACLQHAEKRRNACYKGEPDPGPFNGNAWPGGRNR